MTTARQPEMNPAALRVAPVLLVRSVTDAVSCWRDLLGFDRVETFGHPPHFAIVSRGAVSVMLAALPPGAAHTPHWRTVQNMWNAYIWVDDAAAMYHELCARGATIDYELHEKPYGCLEFGVRDADDHDIAFGQVLRPA